MSDRSQHLEDSGSHHINKIVSVTLSTGMIVTIAVYLFGILLSFLKLKKIPSISHQYFSSIGGFLSGIVHLDPRSFLFLGTATLIFTPAVCVLLSALVFWKHKDFKYVGVTTVVFVIIMISVLIGSIFKVKAG